MKNNGCFIFFSIKNVWRKKNDILQPILLFEKLRLFLILGFMKENEMRNNFSLLFYDINYVIMWFK